MATERKVCEYLHLPLQAGSDDVLKRMNRKYTYGIYLEKVMKAKEKVKGLALSSDFIVGFPGESDEDFECTLKAISEIEYETIFAFKYSPRPNTVSAKMVDDVPDSIKAERLKLLLDIQSDITARLLKNQVGEIQEVLVEGVSKKDDRIFSGRNRRNRIVNFISNGRVKVGDLVNVKITAAKKNSLFGEEI